MTALPKNWQMKLYFHFTAWLLAGGLFAAYFYSAASIIYVLIGGASLLLGFKITEYLVACFTGVRKANGTAVALLFLGKLLWWVGLFLLAKKLPAEGNIPMGIGLGTFLCAVLSLVVFSVAPPKISAAREDR